MSKGRHGTISEKSTHEHLRGSRQCPYPWPDRECLRVAHLAAVFSSSRKTSSIHILSWEDICRVVGAEVARIRGFWCRFARIPTIQGFPRRWLVAMSTSRTS